MNQQDQNELIIEMKITQDLMMSRIDKHSYEASENFKNLNKKMDDLKDSQHKDKEELKEKIHQIELGSSITKGKVATLSAAVSLIVSGALALLKFKIFGDK